MLPHPRARSHRARNVGLSALLGAFAVFVGWQGGLDGPTCRYWSTHLTVQPKVGHDLPFCPKRFHSFTDVQALALNAEFVAESAIRSDERPAGGVGPDVRVYGVDAWGQLADDLKDSLTRERFSEQHKQWRAAEVISSERIEGEFNRFRVRLRVYSQRESQTNISMPGAIATFSQELEWTRREEGDPVVTAIGRLHPIAEDTADFPRIRTVTDWWNQDEANVYSHADRSSEAVSLGARYGSGGVLTALCRLGVDDDLHADEAWLRVPQGWIPLEFFQPDKRLDQLSNCAGTF